VTESDKHYIQSGPSWQEKAPLFNVRVHDPETRRKMVGMQEYTLFQVTSTVRPKESPCLLSARHVKKKPAS
jgi:sorting nexin-9/18/33